MDGLSLGLAVAIPPLMLGLVAGFIIYLMRASRTTVNVLRTVAAELGLSDVQLIADVQSSMSGRFERFRVTVTEVPNHPEERTRNQDAMQRVTEIVVAGDITPDLALRPEPRGLNRLVPWPPPDVLTGDDSFDDVVRVTGVPDLVLSVLDHETRRMAGKAVSEGVLLRGGQLFVVLPGPPGPVPTLITRVRQLLALARRLAPPSNVAAELARTAVRDPLSAVRERALQLLVDHHGHRPETADSLRLALDDEAWHVRLVAAIALREEGHPTLLNLAEQSDAPPDVAVRAAAALGDKLPLSTATRLLDTMLAARNVALAATVVRALGACKAPGAEERLTALLEHDSVELSIAAAAALERVGTVAAVPGLRAAADHRSGNRRLRRVVAAAVASIQNRATGATPGQLSLSASTAGEVALADDGAGDLSLVD